MTTESTNPILHLRERSVSLRKMGCCSLQPAAEIVGDGLSNLTASGEPVFTVTVTCGDDRSEVNVNGILKLLKRIAPRVGCFGLVETGYYEDATLMPDYFSSIALQMRVIAFNCDSSEIAEFCGVCDELLARPFEWRGVSSWNETYLEGAAEWLKCFMRSPVAQYRTRELYAKRFGDAEDAVPGDDRFHDPIWRKRIKRRSAWRFTDALCLGDSLLACGEGLNVLAKTISDPRWCWGGGENVGKGWRISYITEIRRSRS
jgi:hypothetical protein